MDTTTLPPVTSTLHHGDCLEVMPTLEPQSVACVFADLPYGITRNKWDLVIALEPFWAAIDHCGTPAAITLLTATMPFGAHLIASDPKRFRYDLIFEKTLATGHLNAPYAPLRAHESVLVFAKKRGTFNPQRTVATTSYGQRVNKVINRSSNYDNTNRGDVITRDDGFRHPRSVVRFVSEKQQKSLHPTQKPLALLEYLIRAYTNPGDTVLDPVMGSGTTGVACANLGRSFVGIEKDAAYFAVAQQRIAAATATPRLICAP